MLIAVAIFAGVTGGAVCSVWLSARFVRWLLPTPEAHRAAYIFAAIGGALALLPAFFLSIILGGPIGAAVTQVASSGIGMQEAMIPLGLSLGIMVVLGGLLSAGAAIGALTAKLALPASRASSDT